MEFVCLECGTEITFPTPEKEGGKWQSEAICPVCGAVYVAYVVKRARRVKL